MIPKPPELDPATSPDKLDISYLFGPWEWLALAAVLLVIAAVVWFIIRKRRKPVIPPTAEEIARGQIMELRQRKPGLRESATELSLILRSYLSGKSEDPALYETQQEFDRRADALSSLPDILQTEARDLLHRMSTLKYSSQSPQDEELTNNLFDETLELIGNIEREMAARAAQKNSPDDAPTRPEKISF